MRGETYTCGLGDSFDGESLVVVYSHCDALVVVLGGLRLSSTPSLGRRKPIPHSAACAIQHGASDQTLARVTGTRVASRRPRLSLSSSVSARFHLRRFLAPRPQKR